MDRTLLKQKAKDSLKGKYADSIIVILISAILGGISGLISGIGEGLEIFSLQILGDIISFLVSAFITFGSLSFFLKISRNEEVTYQELFSKTKMFVPYLLISLLVGIFTVLWSILFIIPGIIAAISYSQSYLIALDNPDIDPMEAIRESKRLMNGHKMEFFILNLSFLGWAILGIFTFGILYFWLIPYMSVTQANFYNALLEEKNK